MTAQDPHVEIDDLGESGLLWLFNTTALHPHGLALELYGTERRMRLCVYDAEGPVYFTEELAQAGWEKFRATIRELNEARKSALDHQQKGGPDSGPVIP